MSPLKKEIEQDISEYLKLNDKEIQDKLNAQAQIAFNYIMTVEAKLKQQPKMWTYELNFIKKIYSYVLKHKFLPESYHRMLGLWHIRAMRE